MELWEKDYLELLQSRRENQSKYTNGQQKYINECWEEVTRPDGSKWYIPKQENFNEQNQKRRYKTHIQKSNRGRENMYAKRYYADKVSFFKTLLRTSFRLLRLFFIAVFFGLLIYFGNGNENILTLITLAWFVISIGIILHFIYFTIRCFLEGNLRL